MKEVSRCAAPESFTACPAKRDGVLFLQGGEDDGLGDMDCLIEGIRRTSHRCCEYDYESGGPAE